MDVIVVMVADKMTIVPAGAVVADSVMKLNTMIINVVQATIWPSLVRKWTE